ncbi:MAG: translation initiation factor IF-2 [Gemmatimonadaceae bacterium]|nr:translation initiation factor IF-2 [Gemmatimonadaceae bacterium]
MDVPARSPATPLTDDQVSRVRARWEREKRHRAAPAPAEAAPARRRKTAAPAAPAPVPEPDPVAAEAGAVRRRRRADLPPVVEVEPPVVEEAEPVVSAPVVERVVERVAPERPAAPAPVEVVAPPPVMATPSTPVTPIAPSAPTPVAPSGGAPDRPRPRPVVPGAPRLRPIASAAPSNRPNPIASASPSSGGAGTASPRRDDPRRGGPGGGGQQPSMPAGGSAQQRRGKKGRRGSVDQDAVAQNISRTMTAMRGAPSRRGGRRFDEFSREELAQQRIDARERERKTVRVNEFITVSELAQTLNIPPTQIVGFAFKTLGLMVTINQRLDFDQIELIAGEFGFQAVREADYSADLAESTVEDAAEDRVPRPPIVTIMGHVDHGKTSLLDYIRRANVVAGEAGGITQHIGAYHVNLPSGKAITFLDTPGHQAFTAMRARGAQVTDVVVLVVAADDQVMPQTVEAISHARNAGVPMVVAINKVDLPTANVMKVKQDLLQHEVVVEDFGGQTLSTPISAKQGTGVPELLDQVLLQAEILDLRANPDRRAIGAVIEAQLDPGKGPVATVLVQNGTLKVGDDFIVGIHSGRVRALLDERGKPQKEAGPAIPVQVLGLTGVPMAGDQFVVVEDATEAREIAQKRERLDREAKSRRTSKGMVSLEDFMKETAAGQKRTLRIVIKADQGGPAEAVADALGQLSNTEVEVQVIHRGVGAITESDIMLAKASGAIIIGFHVRPDNNARNAAEREGVDIKLYRIIYEAVADVKAALEGMLRPEQREVVFAEIEVRETFKVARIGTIAGCFVRSGTVTRQGRVRVIRDGVEVFDGVLASLRRFKEDVREVKEGYECGIGVENFNDIKVALDSAPAS